MKKPKVSLGPGGFKGLLIQHVEKIVFGAAILGLVAFVFLGYKLDSKLAGKTPDQLQTIAANAVANIERPSADVLKAERTPRNGKGGQYFARVQGIDPLDPQNYALKPFKPPTVAPGSKREDPEIFAPIKLETSAVTGALCLKAQEGQKNALAGLEYARAPEQKKDTAKEERKKSRGSRRGSGSAGGSPYGSGGSSPYGSGDDYAGMMGSGGSPYGKDDGERKKENLPRGPERFYPEDKVCGYRPAGAGMSMARGGSPYGSGGSPYGSSGSPYGSTGSPYGSTGSPGGSLGPSTGSLGIPGTMGPGSTGPGRTPGRPAGASDDQALIEGEPVAQSGSVIAVKALVPYRKQADEYKRVLGEAIGYDPVRDQPWIVFFQAQRVDVTDDPQREVHEAEWQSIMNTNSAAAKIRTLRWHGLMPEAADSMYVDASITMPAPPMMLRCMDEVMLHSDVPRSKTIATFETAEPDEGQNAQKPGDEEDMDLPTAGLGGAGFAGGGMSPYGSTGMMPGYGSTMPGYGSTMPGVGSTMPGSGSTMPGYGSTMPGYGSTMPGSGSTMPGYGMGGYGGGYSASAQLVQYKLIRFFDTDVQPGRYYRYRVRVFLEDPNNPNSDPDSGLVRFAPPPRRSLSLKVLDRVTKVKADDEAKNAEKASGKKVTTYYVISPWSEATDPVSLPSTSRVYAGSVEPARTTLGVDGTPVLQTEPYGYVVPVVWDAPRAVDVATEARSVRGSVLDFSRKQFDVLDPVSLAIRVLKGYDLTSQYQVLDMRGGEDLPGDRKELVTSVGEFLVMDDAGGFRVINELDDFKDFARYTFEDEIASSSPRGGFGSGGMMPGSGGMTPGAGGIPSTGAPSMPGTGLSLPGTGGPAGSTGSKRGRGR